MLQLWLGPTSSELTFFSILIYPAQFASRTDEIIRIRCLNFGSKFDCVSWYCCLFLTTFMPNDAHTFNACVEMM